MAHLHNLRKNLKPSLLDGIGQKVRTVAEIVGTAKGLHDVGKDYIHLEECGASNYSIIIKNI